MSSYALKIGEAEVARYRLMADRARESERDLLAAAGVVAGASVADVGCGPAAMSVALAELVGPSGRVVGVERDPQALQHAAEMVGASGLANLEVRPGDATATGLSPGSFDVAMVRHVLAHNGGREADIVAHVATLVRPGGAVYLVDVDLTAVRVLHISDAVADINERYVAFHRKLGNDPLVGLKLADLLAGAGLEVERFEGRYQIVEAPPGLRPPPWAARAAMLAEGVVDEATLARWEAAFQEADAATQRPRIFAPQFVAVGRRR